MYCCADHREEVVQVGVVDCYRCCGFCWVYLLHCNDREDEHQQDTHPIYPTCSCRDFTFHASRDGHIMRVLEEDVV